MPDLKLLFVAHGYPPYAWGGVETQTEDLVTALSNQGVHVTVCCGGYPHFQSEQSKNLEIIRLPTLEYPPRFLWFQIINRGLLIKKMRKSDIVHSQMTSYTINSLIRRRERQPWIVSLHQSPLGDLKVVLETPPKEWTLGDVGTHILGFPVWTTLQYLDARYSDKFVTCGKVAAQDIINLYGFNKSKMQIIPNGIDFNKFETLLKHSPPIKPNNEPTIFFSGRLYWKKGIEYLVRAMPIIVNEHERVVLKIFGRGPLESKISRLISSLHLEKNVKLMGYVEYSHLIKELSRADVAVFPSLHEGLAIAMLEAMACAKPIVAYNLPFASEIIRNGDNGLLVPPRSIVELSKAILVLLSDERLRLRMGRSGLDLVKQRYNWNILVKQYIDLYEETLRSIKS